MANSENLLASARELGIVPSTLSRVLARIERKVGVQLFDRTSRGLRLNEFGRLYYGAAQKSLNELNDVQAQIADLTNPDRGEVRLSYLESAGAWFADEFLGPFRLLSPDVRLCARTGTTESLRHDLISGRAHFIVTSVCPDIPQSGWAVLKREPLYLVVSRDHVLAQRTSISLSESASENFILSTRDHCILRRPLRELFARAGINPKITADVSDFVTTRILVAAGVGVAVMPKLHTVPQQMDLVYLDLLDEGAYRDLGVAWMRDRHLPASSKLFHQFVLAHCS